MKYQRIFLCLAFLSIIFCKFECNEFCENFGISEKSEFDEGETKCDEENVCCNSNILEAMRITYDQAKKESYQDSFKKLLKSFKKLNTEVKAPHIKMNLQSKENQETKMQNVLADVHMHKRTDGEVVYSALHYAACNLVKEYESMSELDSRVISTLKNAKCICNHPIVKYLVEERVESITDLYTTYNDGLIELRELTAKINLVENENFEEELVDKQLKAVVCKQCSGHKEPMCMSECHELINLGMTFEVKKLQLLEGIVKLTQDKFEKVSTQFEEINSEFENAILSMKDSIVAEVLQGRDFNQENCEEVNENITEERRLIFEDIGAGCSVSPTKCNSGNIQSCTLNNCGNQCCVNICNGNSNKKCMIPTCKGCKGTAAAACAADITSKCSGITKKQSQVNVERITELLYTIQDQIEESKRNLGSHGRYICQQLMETHEDINLIKDCNEREFGGDFDNMLNEVFSEEQMQYYFGANQQMDDALKEFNELGIY